MGHGGVGEEDGAEEEHGEDDEVSEDGTASTDLASPEMVKPSPEEAGCRGP